MASIERGALSGSLALEVELRTMASMARIRTLGNPILTSPLKEVTSFDDNLSELVTEMEQMLAAGSSLGLAANQIGSTKRVFAYQVDGVIGHIVNPEIGNLVGEARYDEGCLSLPGITVTLARPKSLIAAGYDKHGEEVVFEAEDVLARVIQHELDHLDGILMIDRLDFVERKAAVKRYRAAQRAR